MTDHDTSDDRSEQNRAPRKVVVVLTDDEWRQVRINAAATDTTIQGYLTDVVLSELQRRTS